MRTIMLDQAGSLTIADVENVAYGRAKVGLDPAARDRLAAFRARAESELKTALDRDSDTRVYGLNTGFGSNFKEYVSPGDLKQLQENLILSHCAGTGPSAPAPVVRATMLLRAASLARGRSIVRPVVVETLVDMLNTGVTPAVPRYGTVSASGDLAPLSHVAAVVIGRGRVLDGEGRAVPTADFLKTAKGAFTPIALEMKEGLALNNGCQYSNAWGALAATMMRRLIEAAALNAAIGVQVMRGAGRPFRADLHALRPHSGSQQVAAWVFDLLDGYQFRDVGTDAKYDYDQKIQDPYNLRCAAQVLGPCLDLIERAETTLTIEARSVTDNPIDLNTDVDSYDLDLITSGGHFHGMPLAVDTYGLLQAAAIMARLSNLRCMRIVDAARNKGLGPQVRGANAKATESGLMISEYTTAGLCNHIWGLAAPSHVMSISTDSGQEDHVSMAANVAMRAYEAAERLAELFAIELAFAAQAERVRQAEMGEPHALAPAALGKATQAALKAVDKAFPPLDGDRELSWDLMQLAEKVLTGEIAQASGYAFARH
ncbi:MAG TPA: aromatic amino acid ammonia-lyase [Vitreimonas sp.]|uniref:HAL/PAL/TAL family ammonia-lyase n=1 Tax=Vitreimonas sp. TaxID=3069702 RepID=UPI002D520728|nr:aromatic amino acid ammonia-lyase [Vitreimonas sp.]HYD86501.1 aromatic amino acid ammonia-lyase [Vitreimonas sp.]